MKNPLHVTELRELLAKNDSKALQDLCSSSHPATIADFLGALSPSEVWSSLTLLEPRPQAEIFGHLSEELQLELAESLNRQDLGQIVTYMSADERVDLLKRLPEDKQETLLPVLAHAEREDIRRLSSYREGTVGSVMTSDYATLSPEHTAREAIAKYDLIALPVVNGDDVLVGIITHDDAIDIIHQEHTEDMEKFMAITGSHETGVYLRTPSWEHFKKRAYWIVSLAALGLVSGLIIHRFEATLMHLLILAFYMPMVADTGGNTGSQSATVIIRALALKEISPKDVLRIFFKEFKVSILLAMVLGLMSFGKVMFLSGGSQIPTGVSLHLIAFAIALALGLQVITATLIGALLPILAVKLRLDPAVVASPALTTIVDITGLLIYFTKATLLLGI